MAHTWLDKGMELRLPSMNYERDIHVMISPEELMRLAIDKAVDGIQRGQSPFGCAIADSGGVVSVSHNRVLLDADITSHAEVNAIRQACRLRDTIWLDECIVATTCEPCPMCVAALHWARVKTVYFGATIADAASAGFNELNLPASEVLRQGGSSVILRGEVLAEDCRELFRTWSTRGSNQAY